MLPLRDARLGLLSLPFAAALTLGPTGLALAADTLPPGRYDAGSIGRVASPEAGAPGAMAAGVAFDASGSVLDEENLRVGAGEEKPALLRDANRFSAYFGASVSSMLELSLGLHGTYEHVPSAERDVLYPEATAPADAETEDVESWRANTRQTSFAGASLMLKIRLLDQGSFKLALAPFVESGAGESATYTLTRSVGPKAGFMTLASYGARGVADVTANAGFRYRDPEEVGGLLLRNELFYRAAVRAWASRDAFFFLAGEGRKLMTARLEEKDPELGESGDRTWRPDEAAGASAGIGVKLGDTELSAFGGARLAGAKGFGYGTSTWGVALTTALDTGRGTKARPSFATEIEAERDRKAAADAASEPAKATASAREEYPEMIGADVDPLEGVADESGNEFALAKQKAAEARAQSSGESEDAKIERELKQLKEAEAKAAKDEAALAAQEADAARAERARAASEDDELRREWMEEAKKDAEAIDGSNDDDLGWNGLEQ